METVMDEFENEIRVMKLIVEKVGGEIDGEVITFDPFSLLRFADFLVSSTLENYEELQNTKDL